MWNIESGECVKTIKNAHEEFIYSLLKLSDTTLLSGSKDTTIKVWKLPEFQEIRILKGHSDAIMKMAPISETEFVSGSLDTTIR